MRLAFIDNLSVAGGLSRFSLLLCKGLIENNPTLTIDYYIHYNNLKHIPEIKHLDKRVKVILIESSIPQNKFAEIINRVISKFSGKKATDKILLEI